MHFAQVRNSTIIKGIIDALDTNLKMYWSLQQRQKPPQPPPPSQPPQLRQLVKGPTVGSPYY